MAIPTTSPSASTGPAQSTTLASRNTNNLLGSRLSGGYSPLTHNNQINAKYPTAVEPPCWRLPNVSSQNHTQSIHFFITLNTERRSNEHYPADYHHIAHSSKHNGNHGLPQLIGIAFCVLLHLWRKNIFLTIAGGTLFYMAIIHIIPLL
ncbi:MAG: AzlD domain-containing protein [Bacteroidales bacterium]|nr:AzlD domain-containing protein [Bacteroidales bacterium]